MHWPHIDKGINDTQLAESDLLRDAAADALKEVHFLREALRGAVKLISAYCPGPGDAWQTKHVDVLTRL